MSKLDAPNFHANEEAVAPTVSPTSQTIFDKIAADLGLHSQTSFRDLDKALDDLLTVINKMINDIADKKKALTTNLKLVNYSVIKIPTPTPPVPDLVPISKTINQVVGNYVAPDIQNLQATVSLALLVRLPNNVTNFEKAKISLVGGKLDRELGEAMAAQDLINSIKKIISTKM